MVWEDLDGRTSYIEDLRLPTQNQEERKNDNSHLNTVMPKHHLHSPASVVAARPEEPACILLLSPLLPSL
jgi:hypothetical protein